MLHALGQLGVSLALRKIPVAPFAGAAYKTTLTTTVNETTSIFTGVSVGAPHPDRVVVLAIHQGVNGDVTAASVADYAFYHKTRLNEFAITAHRLPNDVSNAGISISATSSLRKSIGIFVCYPSNPIPTDFGSASAAAGNNAVIGNLEAQGGGCLIYSGGQNATLGSFTTTFGGGEAVNEDVDAQYESASTYTQGHINLITSAMGATARTLQMAASVNGTKRLVAVLFGPPRYWVG